MLRGIAGFLIKTTKMIEIEPETMTAAPLIGVDFTENGQMSEIGKTSRRQPNPPAPVQIETPESIFAAAVAAINKRYQLGTLGRLAIERPDLAAEIERATDRVDITWRESGPVGSPAFKLALRTWYDLVILAIDYFEGATNGK